MRIPLPSRYRRILGIVASLFCSLTAPAQTAPTWTSATAIGGSNILGAMAVDAAGNMYEAGNFTGTTTLHGTVLTSAGGTDGFLAKYSPTGALLWVRQLGSTGSENALDVGLDAAGNCYVTGFFQGSIALGNGVELNGSIRNAKAFLVRYSPAGTPEWAQQSRLPAPTGASAFASGLSFDAAGHVYLTGRFIESVTFGPASISTPFDSAEDGVFLARFSAGTGAVESLVRAYYYAAPTTSGAHLYRYPKVAVTPTGEAYVLAFFTEQPVLGVTTLTSRGSTDILLAKYTAQGVLEWVQQLGGPGDDRFAQAQADQLGNLYVAGYFTGPALFGTSPVAGTGGWDGYLAKYSPQGTLVWVQPSGGAADDRWNGLRLDAAGNPYVTGSFSDVARFGPFTLTSAGSLETVVASYTPQGQVRWAQQSSGLNYDFGSYLGLDAQGNLYIQGRFAGTATFGPFGLTTANPAGENFLARLGTATLATRAAQPLALGFYPNPAADQLYLPGLAAGSRVQLVDARGRVAHEAVVSAAAQISVRGMVPGLYTLRATDGQGRQQAGRVVVR